MRRQRSDANQTAIIRRYEAHGCSVLVLSQTHPVDLLVGYCGVDALVEVKDGNKPPSRRTLTAGEQDLHAKWRGRPVRIVLSPDDVDTHVMQMNRHAQAKPAPSRWALDHCS